MVDDDEQRAETYCQHALDALGSQAGDHFAEDLVHTDAGNVLRSPANQSIHAPAYLLKGLHEWLVKNCLEFLKPKLTSYWLNGSSRSLDSWLLRPQLEGKECAKVGITPQMHWETLVCYSRTVLFWMRPTSSGRR